MFKLEKDVVETELCCWFYPLTWIVLMVVSYIDWLICAAMVLIVPLLLMFMHYTTSATQAQRSVVVLRWPIGVNPFQSFLLDPLWPSRFDSCNPFLELISAGSFTPERCHLTPSSKMSWTQPAQQNLVRNPPELNHTTSGVGLLLLKSCALTWNRLHVQKLLDVSKARFIQIVSHDCVTS